MTMAQAHDVLPEADALYSFAFMFLDGGRTTDARDVFRAMLLLFPRDERAWLGLARCHEQLGDVALAVELCSFALVACAPAVRSRVALSRLLRSTGRDDDAADVLDRAADAAADDEALSALVDDARRAA